MNLAPISLQAPQLLVQAVSDGRRLGLQLFNVPNVAVRLSKSGAWWCPGRRMWLLEQTNVDRTLAWLHSLYDGQHVDLGGAGEQLSAAINNSSIPCPNGGRVNARIIITSQSRNFRTGET